MNEALTNEQEKLRKKYEYLRKIEINAAHFDRDDEQELVIELCDQAEMVLDVLALLRTKGYKVHDQVTEVTLIRLYEDIVKEAEHHE